MSRQPASIGALIAKPGRIGIIDFLGLLRWLDGRELLGLIDGYRRRLFTEALDAFEPDGRPRYNLVLAGRAKKNWKSADLVLALLYRLIANDSPGGNQVYLLANDEGQAADDLALAKKLVTVNPLLADRLTVRKNVLERRDDRGFMEILAAGDIAGSHGKTYDAVGFDEIHGYRTWDILEALQPDPTRPEALVWITSYASIYHKPGVPLFDLCRQGRAGADPRMLFSWYAADFTTDADFAEVEPETRANPSMASWEDPDYLRQQQRRLPAHKYRRLHLNLPGLPEGSAFTAEMVMEAIARGVASRRPEPGGSYVAAVDMSGGSSDDATLAIGHLDADGRAVLDRVMNQGASPPFDPRAAVTRFVAALQEYGISTVHGDHYAGETFRKDFERHGIGYQDLEHTRSQLYESLEPRLNAHEVVLLDVPILEQQLLGLVWRGGKIDHAAGEHDDWANAVAGVVALLFGVGSAGLWFQRSGMTTEEASSLGTVALAQPVFSMDHAKQQAGIYEELARQLAEDAVASSAGAASPAMGEGRTADERYLWKDGPSWSNWGPGPGI